MRIAYTVRMEPRLLPWQLGKLPSWVISLWLKTRLVWPGPSANTSSSPLSAPPVATKKLPIQWGIRLVKAYSSQESIIPWFLPGNWSPQLSKTLASLLRHNCPVSCCISKGSQAPTPAFEGISCTQYSFSSPGPKFEPRKISACNCCKLSLQLTFIFFYGRYT